MIICSWYGCLSDCRVERQAAADLRPSESLVATAADSVKNSTKPWKSNGSVDARMRSTLR